jgi:hypothetical protein
MNIMHKVISGFFICYLAISITECLSKRLSPSPVPDIIHNSVVYSAAFSDGGFVAAHDKNTKRLLWKIRVYRIHYQPGLEKDIQDVFIKKMVFKNGNLLIADEKNRRYLLNLRTHKVRFISH